MTETEKTTVVNYVKDLLMNNFDTIFTNEEIRTKINRDLGYSIAPTTLGTIISKKIANQLPKSYRFIKSRNTYRIVMQKEYRLTKEKNQVFLCDEENNLELIWDYNNPNFKNERKAGRYNIVKIDNTSYSDFTISSCISSVPEWVFSYPNILKGVFEHSSNFRRLPRKINKSDIELTFSILHSEKIDNEWVSCLLFVHKVTSNIKDGSLILKSLNKNAIKLLVSLEEYRRIDILNDNIKEMLGLLDLTKKLATCGAKNFENIDYYDIFIMLIEMKNYGWLPYLDTNRTYRQNLQNFTDYKEKKTDEKLSKNLKRLNFLNNYEINEDYIIYVPQDRNDLVLEGKAQNNCVGHYYNSSIADGKDLIYFIRPKTDFTKSFVTCRFNLNTKSTVEHRLKNNKWFENKKLFNKIDEIINTNLN